MTEDSARGRLKARVEAAFTLTRDLAFHLEEASLRLDLPALPSNRLSGQFWCVVGARESYLKAVESGAWAGFSCSLAAPQQKLLVLSALDQTHRQLVALDPNAWDSARQELVLSLFQHEVQHHGQFIRFVYGNRLSFPESWIRQYALD